MKCPITSRLCALGVIMLAAVPLTGSGAPPIQVNAADPSSASQGTISLDVVVSGSGFDSSAAVSFFVTGTTNPGGVTVKNVVVNGSKKLTATIDVADTAVINKFDVEVRLSGGRKGKGTSLFAVLAKANDACANALNFPSFVFVTSSGQSETRVSDQTGSCTRLLKSGLPSLHRAFSYPVIDDAGNATNRGRVVWMGPDPDSVNTPDVEFHAMDFVVAGTSITPGSAYLVANFGPVTSEGGGNGGVCCGLDLSVDGRDMYLPTKAELRAEGYVNKVVRMKLPSNLADLDPANPPQQTTVFEHTPSPRNDTEYATDLDVNAANDFLFVMQNYGQRTGKRVLRIDLDPDRIDNGSTLEAVVVSEPPWEGSAVFVGADMSDPASDLLAIVFAATPEDCNRLTIMNGRTGTVLNEGTEWPAHWLSWANGKVLTRGFRRGCRSLETLVEVDPLTGTTTTLMTGRNPDGR